MLTTVLTDTPLLIAPIPDKLVVQPSPSTILIDKLSLTIELSDADLAVATNNLSQAIDQGWGFRRGSMRYRYAATLFSAEVFESTHPSTFRVDLNPKVSGTRNFRIELNPAKADLLVVAKIMSAIVPSFSEYLANDCRVTRVDLAVDVNQISFADVKVDVAKNRVSQAYWGPSGDLQTQYFGAQKTYVVYDKLQEAAPPQYAPKEPPKPTTLRFEVRYRPPGHLKFSELHMIPNVFQRFKVVAWSEFSSVKQSNQFWLKLFLDSVQQRGLTATQQLLPPAERKFVQRRMKLCAVDFWDPMDIWESYPQAFKRLEQMYLKSAPIQLHAPNAVV